MCTKSSGGAAPTPPDRRHRDHPTHTGPSVPGPIHILYSPNGALPNMMFGSATPGLLTRHPLHATRTGTRQSVHRAEPGSSGCQRSSGGSQPLLPRPCARRVVGTAPSRVRSGAIGGEHAHAPPPMQGPSMQSCTGTQHTRGQWLRRVQVAAGSCAAQAEPPCCSWDSTELHGTKFCTAQPGSAGYNFCPETGVHYCCGACNGTSTCPSNSVLKYCACTSPKAPGQHFSSMPSGCGCGTEPMPKLEQDNGYNGRSEALVHAGHLACGCRGRGVEDFDWTTNGCHLPQFAASRFCSVLGRRRLLFIGDSIEDQVAGSVMSHLLWDLAHAQPAQWQPHRLPAAAHVPAL